MKVSARRVLTEAVESQMPHANRALPAGAAASAVIEYRHVSKAFVKDRTIVNVLDDVSLAVCRGEFLAVVGPSGCGKSTLLNLAAGLVRPSRGEVSYCGQQVAAVNSSVGYVTQRDNLMPWRTVADNIELPLELRGVARAERRRLVAEQIEMTGLGGFERHYPRELSGGMRKRVGLARTLVYNPDTLLMDEPFGALDALLKSRMQKELLSLWSGSGKTVVFVTHDLDEALGLADRVVVMSSRPGQIRAIRQVELPRPRVMENVRFASEFRALYLELWSLLSQDVN